MGYKYYTSASPLLSQGVGNDWRNDFNQNLDYNFSLSSDYYVVQEESIFASGILSSVGVRITTAIDPTTGLKYADDYKTILFNSSHGTVYPGYKFYFDNCYWIVSNTTSIKTLVNSCMVRRCNELLRWIDIDGTIYQEPCAIDPEISRADNKTSIEDIITGMGNISIFAQLNSNTQKIIENQRFLFGSPYNWRSFRVLTNGVRNYLRNATEDANSCTLVQYIMKHYQENETTDNLELGIADYYKYDSGSSVNNVVVSPDNFDIVEGDTTTYTVQSYSGSAPISGSFVFAVVDANVPVSNYVLTTINGNSFSVKNVEKYFDSPLNISAVGTSGSRMVNINLVGAW